MQETQPSVWVTLINNLPATLAALGALIVSVKGVHQSRKNTKQLEHVSSEVGGVKSEVNGMKQELIAAKTEAAHASGVLEGALTINAEKVTQKD